MTRADLFVLICAFALLPMLYLEFWQLGGTGTQAQIRIKGQPYTTLALNESQIIHIPGNLGESTLEVKQGHIRFIKSPCHSKQCIHHGWLNRQGEFTACLPNQVSIHILGESREFDAINF